MNDVDSARRGDVRRVAQSLMTQSLLIAVVCLAVDAVTFTVAAPESPIVGRLAVLLVIVAVDGALALPPRFSGLVAVAHALTAIGLAVALRGTIAADFDLVGGLIAGYRAGAWLRGWAGVGSLVALVVGVVVSRPLAASPDTLTVVLEAVKNACIPWLVGRYTTARRAYISELRHHRENERRDAEAEVAKAVAGERTSIARDLHDVISHHVSAIGVHAGAARMLLTAKPGFTDAEITESLTSVERSSRSAMSDLRRLLDILHGSTDSASQPGLGNLDELFDGVRRSGLRTRFELSGTVRELPGSLDVALYRITQEMLTNALRHGDGGAVDIGLEFQEREVVLTARNGLPAPSEKDGRPGGGRGLAGIRSRATLFGGTVRHGPDHGGLQWETVVSMPDHAVSSGEPS